MLELISVQTRNVAKGSLPEPEHVSTHIPVLSAQEMNLARNPVLASAILPIVPH